MARFVLEDAEPQAAKPQRFVMEPEEPAQNTDPLTVGERFARGVMDPIDGGAQLLTHILPESVVSAGNRLNNWLSDTTGLVAKIPEGGVDQMLSDKEAEYQQRRAASVPKSLSSLIAGGNESPGIDWARMGGNVLSPANLAIASRVPAALSLGGRVASGATAGGAISALTPVVGAGDDYASQKGEQIGIGAAFGGAAPAILGGAARVISPKASTNPAVALLQKEGVKPTVGQTLGGRANAFEEKLSSMPIVGDAISNARQRGVEGFNLAALNRAVSPLGQRIATTGREGVAQAKKVLSDAYNALTPKLTFAADQQFASDVAKVQAMVGSSLPPAEYKAFEKVLREQLVGKMTGQGRMSGESFKTIESELSRLAKGYLGDPAFDKRQLGAAYRELLISLRQNLMRTNPAHAKELQAINEGFANFARVRKAASAIGAEEGVFTPNQLQNAVRAADESVGKGNFATGRAFMQDLSEAGKSVLGNKIPNSFTTDRALLAGGGLASGALSPAIPAGLIAGAGAYTQPVQNLLRFLLTARPEAANALADTVRKSYPVLLPASGQVGANALE
ncbi:MAG TPA: hypothetical protein PLC58_15190 [Denitromonas sp.]|nr:hypothetical protein [Denitromonas sp.]